jgi:3-dehydroquinate synthase
VSDQTVIPVDGVAPYDVVVGPGASRLLTSHLREATTVCLVVDPAVAARGEALHDTVAATGASVHVLAVPPGERAKDLTVLRDLWDGFAVAGLSRRDLVVTVGGGATSDVAGFAAATWMRGVRVVHVPTTLLAMVDAAVGGKTGVNTRAGKNLVGSFHPPAAVLVDLDVLETLPRAEWVNGMAEVVKAGFLAEPRILELVRDDPDDAASPIGRSARELIERAIAVKAAVVSSDLKESGVRETLNYGHTLGHAVERRESYGIPHGHAVSVGMVFAAELSALAGRCATELPARHRALLGALGLPTSYRAGVWPELVAAMRHDKKSRAGKLRFVVLEDVGLPVLLEDPPDSLLAAAYERLVAA